MSVVQGKVIIITGASKGIGLAAAEYFAEKGASVVLAARTAAKISEIAAKIGGLAVPTDVASPKDMENLFAKTKEKYGRVDVLISNAGVIDPIAHIVDSDPEEWSKCIDINVKGSAEITFVFPSFVGLHFFGLGPSVSCVPTSSFLSTQKNNFKKFWIFLTFYFIYFFFFYLFIFWFSGFRIF